MGALFRSELLQYLGRYLPFDKDGKKLAILSQNNSPLVHISQDLSFLPLLNQ